jgi:hypothetical protein
MPTRPNTDDPVDPLVPVPGLWEDDVVHVEVLLQQGGFFYRLHHAFGEVPGALLIRQEDLPRVKAYLASYQTRLPSGVRVPIPW